MYLSLSFSFAPHTLKGQGHKITVCEECALIPPVVYFEVIVPTLQLDEAALICISTVRGMQNLFSKMRMLRDSSGELVFNSLDFKIECARPECKINPEKCEHVLTELPGHMSATKARRVRELMSENQDLWLRETRGIESNPAEPLYPLRYIDRLFEPSLRYTRLRHVPKKRIFVNVDPNGAGLSNYAMTSWVEAEGFEVVRSDGGFGVFLFFLSFYFGRTTPTTTASSTARSSSSLVFCHMSIPVANCLSVACVSFCRCGGIGFVMAPSCLQ